MKIFDNLEEIICAIITTVMLVLTFVNVLSRYILHYSVAFTEEITGNLFVLLCTMAAAIAAKRGAHLGLSLIPDALSEKPKAILVGITNILSGLFGLVLLYTGTLMVSHMKMIDAKSITLQFPAWIYGLALPVGAFFIVFRFWQGAYHSFKDAYNIKTETEHGGDN